MVKPSKTPPRKAAAKPDSNKGRTPKPSRRSPLGGRPPGPEEDRRSDRLAFRVHPDLTNELIRIARENGEPRSAWIERVIICVINDSAGYRVLDAIGKYVPYEEPPARLPHGSGRPLHLMPRRQPSLTEDDLRPPTPRPRR
jgi:hypothetical protein